jgi:hypothetical protein
MSTNPGTVDVSMWIYWFTLWLQLLSVSGHLLYPSVSALNGFKRDFGATLCAYLDSGLARSVSISIDTRAAGHNCGSQLSVHHRCLLPHSLPLNVPVQRLAGSCPHTATCIPTTDDVDSPPCLHH